MGRLRRATESAQAQLLASDWLERLVGADLQLMAAAPTRTLSGASETRMTLLAREGLTLSLLLTKPEPPGTPQKLIAASRNAVLGAWGPGKLEVRRLFQPCPFPTEQLRIIDPGIVPQQPSFPNVPLLTGVALLISAMLCLAWLSLRYGLERQRVRSAKFEFKVARSGGR